MENQLRMQNEEEIGVTEIIEEAKLNTLGDEAQGRSIKPCTLIP